MFFIYYLLNLLFSEDLKLNKDLKLQYEQFID